VNINKIKKPQPTTTTTTTTFMIDIPRPYVLLIFRKEKRTRITATV
jgi:hypothetical protein